MKEKLVSGFALLAGQLRIFLRPFISSYLKNPDFVFLGPQKCGTSSLARYLRNHPNVLPARKKEIHFFDQNYKKGKTWYKANFPSKPYLSLYSRITKREPIIFGDSTSYYFNCPHLPERISNELPSIKLIIMLRNPVKRTYSHYYHERNKGFELLPIDEALKNEKKRIKQELEKIDKNPYYYSFIHHHFSYLDTSHYAKHLKNWFEHFSRDQIMIIQSEMFFKKTANIYKQVLDFLNIPHIIPESFKIYNKNKYPQIDQKLQKKLEDYFVPLNEELYKLLGYSFDW